MTRPTWRRSAATWLLPLLLLFGPLAVHAQDWVYRVRPTDNLWDLSSRYLKPDVPWQKLQDYNQVGDPQHLPPGMRLRVPVGWLRLQPAKAKVAAIFGHAQAQLPGQAQPVQLSQGMELDFGSDITTGKEANLTLEFADGSRVLMQEDSELSLDRMSAYGSTGMVDTRLRLQRGRVTSDVIPAAGAASHFSISTPTAVSSVRGTHFRVAADGDGGRSQTEVVGGRVDVAGQGGHVLVAAGRGTTVAEGGKPGRPQDLLEAPALRCPPGPLSHFPSVLDWPALAGAARYRVQVAPDARFESLLQDKLVDTPHASVTDLPDGSYALRVRGVDAQRLEGRDAICTMQIAAHPQPPVVLEPKAEEKARGEHPRFRWTETEDAVSYAWQLASDAGFQHLLAQQDPVKGDGLRAPNALPYGRYYWRVATRDASGKLGPYSDAQPFELVAEPPTPAVGAPTHSHGELDFRWQAGAPGQRYHLQLARDPKFAKPTVDRTVDTAQLTIPKPGSGTWYLRVQTIDTDGYVGPWGSVQKLKLACIACRIALGGGAAVVVLLLL